MQSGSLLPSSRLAAGMTQGEGRYGQIAAQACKTLAFASILAHSFLSQVPALAAGESGIR